MTRMFRIFEAQKLRDSDFLVQHPMEEGIRNVDLMQNPISENSDSKDQSNGDQLNHQAEHLHVVYSFDLQHKIMTWCTLRHSMLPSGFYLTLKSHLEFIMLSVGDHGMRVHVIFDWTARTSNSMACLQSTLPNFEILSIIFKNLGTKTKFKKYFHYNLREFIDFYLHFLYYMCKHKSK